ncbi:hypothetical protein [Streptomyces sp. NPDC087437]|uniref:hypothetical protein n=1 Tax=Streptomyces sp. NPDC087437 TaxID=3365789 RepID=UPI00381E3272
MANHDAWAARDVLHHHATRPHLTSEQIRKLTAVITASGLGAGNLPQAHMQALSEAVTQAEAALGELLLRDHHTTLQARTEEEAAHEALPR